MPAVLPPAVPAALPPARVLLTYFGPFGDVAINPCVRIAQRVETIFANVLAEAAGVQLATLELPVSYRLVPRLVEDQLARLRPDLTIALGLAQSRTQLCLERNAFRAVTTRLPDACGDAPAATAPVDGSSLWGGCGADGPHAGAELPDCLGARFDTATAATSLNRPDLAVTESLSAGGYVCNYTAYYLYHRLRTLGGAGVFVHIPPLEVSGETACAEAVCALIANRQWWLDENLTPRATPGGALTPDLDATATRSD